MYYGLYEPHLTNWIRTNVRAGDVVIEPGVNIGFITGHLLEQVGERGLVIALEPSRTCAEQLHRNNDLTSIPGLVFINAAIAEASREATYRETPRIISRGFGCLEEVGQPDGTSYMVNTISLDDLLSKYGIRKVRFLKLDIEGSELIALRGASDALAEGRIDNVMVETTYDPSDSDSVAHNGSIAEILRNADFHPHSMLRNGTVRPLDFDVIGTKSFRQDVMWSRS
jgi:FkbM family methyltransferase